MKHVLKIFAIIFIFFTTKVLFAEEEIDFSEISSWEMIVIKWWEIIEDKENFIKNEPSKENISLPLKNTSVQSEISGFVWRTTVTQIFQNPYNTPIEAIYLFPLPNDASIDSMTMEIWERKIIWKIEKKTKAEELYQDAKNNWQTASVLHQQRENIFTQKVANILPWEEIKIHISYFETIKYEKGKYNYVFPIVVWPRYSRDSVTDKENITSPTISKDSINGHNINIKLKINAGVNIKQLNSASHDVDIKKISESEVEISLKNKQEIPNKDFSFEYNVSADTPQMWFLFHKDEENKNGYFTFLIEPQNKPTTKDIRNKEIVFVLDTSWSMSGRPIESVKKAMQKAIENLWENDYINIYSFNNWIEKLYIESKKANNNIKNEALTFVNNLQAWWWTVMDEPFKEALKDNGDYDDRMRIILIMTDWDIGNETDILHTIKTNLWKNRVFALWVDSAPNRYLLDSISEAWKWKTTYILEKDNIDEKVDEFYNTFKSPLLTDIEIDWDWIDTFDVLPKNIPDLYDGQPIKITWKYKWTLLSSLDKTKNISIKAKSWNTDFSQNISLTFPSTEKENNSLQWLWAKQKVKDIYQENLYQTNGKLEEEVTALGLNYSIMTNFTSFIAIDDQIRTSTWETQTIQVPNYEVEWKVYTNNSSFAGDSSLMFGASNVSNSSFAIKGKTLNIGLGEDNDVFLKNNLSIIIKITFAIIWVILIVFFIRRKYRRL